MFDWFGSLYEFLIVTSISKKILISWWVVFIRRKEMIKAKQKGNSDHIIVVISIFNAQMVNVVSIIIFAMLQFINVGSFMSSAIV